MLTSHVFGHLDESTQVGNEGYLWNGAGYGIGAHKDLDTIRKKIEHPPGGYYIQFESESLDRLEHWYPDSIEPIG